LAFTATPKAKTLELFGRRPKPDEPPSKQNLPEAFQPYYETAELKCVSDPDLIFDLFDKLRASGIFLWQEVALFCEAFLVSSKSDKSLANVARRR
jgi:hypothetical protein